MTAKKLPRCARMNGFLSGGEHIGRALMARPKLLLLDLGDPQCWTLRSFSSGIFAVVICYSEAY